MGNETKERLPLRMKPETSRRLEQWYAADNCRSKNEFVEKAVNFYVDYLEMRDAQSLLPAALLAVLDGRLGRLEDLIARREYTREVELDMVIGIIADAMEIDRDDLKRRRAESVSVGSSQPHFVGSIEPIIVGNVRANGLKYKMPTTQICSL